MFKMLVMFDYAVDQTFNPEKYGEGYSPPNTHTHPAPLAPRFLH